MMLRPLGILLILLCGVAAAQETTAESTFGRGRKASGGRMNSILGSVKTCTITERTP